MQSGKNWLRYNAADATSERRTPGCRVSATIESFSATVTTGGFQAAQRCLKERYLDAHLKRS
jgi:hypothetical protein